MRILYYILFLITASAAAEESQKNSEPSVGGNVVHGTCQDGTDVWVRFGYGSFMKPTKTRKQLSQELNEKCKEKGSILQEMDIPFFEKTLPIKFFLKEVAIVSLK